MILLKYILHSHQASLKFEFDIYTAFLLKFSLKKRILRTPVHNTALLEDSITALLNLTYIKNAKSFRLLEGR